MSLLREDEATTIGERLRRLRLWRGMTLAEVGGLAGVSAAYLSYVERGLRPLDRRSTISALAAALRVSETDLTGGAHLGSDRLQSEPHGAIPALRIALSANTVGDPATDAARPLPQVMADVKSLRLAHASGDYLTLGPALPDVLGELYFYVSRPEDGGGHRTAARGLVDICGWAAWMCHSLQYGDLAQVAANSAMQAASVAGDPISQGKAQFARIGTAPRAWSRSLVMAEKAANELEPDAKDPLGLQVLGMLTLRCALAATAVQDAGATEHWLGEARALADRVNDDDPIRNWEWFGTTNVDIWSAALAVERGEPGGAVLEAAARVNPEKLTVGTRRAGLYLEMGRALARDRGKQAEAMGWLRQAERAAPQWIRNYAPAREAVAFLLTRARVTAGGRDLRGMASRMGVAH